MIYKFSDFLELHYQELQPFIEVDEKLTKQELLERCAGEISYELLQCMKELQFSKISKNADNELFLV